MPTILEITPQGSTEHEMDERTYHLIQALLIDWSHDPLSWRKRTVTQAINMLPPEIKGGVRSKPVPSGGTSNVNALYYDEDAA